MCVHHCFQIKFTHFLKSAISVLWECICSYLSMGVINNSSKTEHCKGLKKEQVIKQASLSWESLHRWCSRTLFLSVKLYQISVNEKWIISEVFLCKSHTITPSMKVGIVNLWLLGEKCSSKYCHIWDWIKRRSHKQLSPLVTSPKAAWYICAVELLPYQDDRQSISFSFPNSLCVSFVFTKEKVTLSNSWI